jgi:hypothetical protein
MLLKTNTSPIPETITTSQIDADLDVSDLIDDAEQQLQCRTPFRRLHRSAPPLSSSEDADSPATHPLLHNIMDIPNELLPALTENAVTAEMVQELMQNSVVESATQSTQTSHSQSIEQSSQDTQEFQPGKSIK